MSLFVPNGCYYVLVPMRYEGFRKLERRQKMSEQGETGRTHRASCLQLLFFGFSSSSDTSIFPWAKTDMTLAEVPLSLAATRLPEIIKILLKTGNVPIAPCHLTSMSFPNFHCPHFHLFTSLDLITCVLLACHCPVTCDHLPLPLVRLRAFL